MRKKLSLTIVLEILILITVFVFMIYPPIDNDLGWHLRYGQYFWQTGHILTHDIFSSTLPNYYWVNGSGWAYDILIYPIFKAFGFIGLSIWGALTVTLAFLLITLTYKIKPWLKMFLLPAYLLLSYNVVLAGMRAQLDTILGLSLVFFLLSKKKFIYLPFVFLIWANLHGGFILGLIVWFIFLAWRIITGFRNTKKHKELLTELRIFILSVLACLINPFTYQIFTEDFKHTASPMLIKYITEWTPIETGSIYERGFDIYSGMLAIMSAFILIKDWKKFFPHILIAAIFFFLSLGSRRYIVIYALCSFPIVLIFLEQFQSMIIIKLHKILNLLALIIILPLLLYALFIKLPTINLTTFDWSSYCSYVGCSEKLSNFLNQNPPQGRGFNTYNLGGYLIWRVPKIKTFVDGRMSVWEENGVNPFRDFVNIYYNADWMQAFEEQNLSWAIVVPGTNLDNYLFSKSKVWKLEYFDNKVSYYVKH